MAHAQLHLIDFADELWKLDEKTIRVGRQGLASARAALARSARPYSHERHDSSAQSDRRRVETSQNTDHRRAA